MEKLPTRTTPPTPSDAWPNPPVAQTRLGGGAWDERMPAAQADASPVTIALRWEHGKLAQVEAMCADQAGARDIGGFLEFVHVRNPYNTWVNYACDLKVFFATVRKPPDQVTRADCVAFMRLQGNANRAVNTINRRLAAVSSLFDELLLRDPTRYTDNPVASRLRKNTRRLYKRAPRRDPDIIPNDDLHTLFDALPTWRDRALLLLQWKSCLRISEALGIRFDDVECSHKRVTIRDSKNHESRDVYMDTETFTAFNRYLDKERIQLEHANAVVDTNAVFLAFRGRNRGQQLSVNAYQKLLVYYVVSCHLDHLHAHLLRHTGITHLLEQGMSEAAVRKLVGHKRPESLIPYTHLTDRFTEREFERAAPALLSFTLADGRDERVGRVGREI